MESKGHKNKDELLIQELRKIILKEDRNELEQLKTTLNNPKLLAQKVDPIIQERIDFLKNNFPNEFNASVEKIVESKLEASQEEIISIIAPRLGLMIKKFVQAQIEQLRESIQAQIDNTLNTGVIGKLRRFLGLAPKADAATFMANAIPPVIEEIFVIEHHSGLLIGSASKNELMNGDVIGGMLTAIKSFVEDSFAKGAQELETIQYETYVILIRSFPSYYIAAAISGTVTATDKNKITEDILRFSQDELHINVKELSGANNPKIKEKLHQYFIDSKKDPITNKQTLTA